MRHRLFITLAAAVAVLATPAAMSTIVTPSSQAGGPWYSAWSAPEFVTPVNSAALEYPNAISRDGLSLYFQRQDAVGLENLYVVHRLDADSPWGTPIKLPDGVNSSANDRAAFVSKDGHWLYFASNRAGGVGDLDLYASWRQDTHDDMAWEEPLNLIAVNTTGFESGPALLEDDETGVRQLYYVSNPGAGGQAFADMYVSTFYPDGSLGPGVLVAELNTPRSEGRPYLRKDGLEIFFQSNRGGAMGIWTSTRVSIDDPWSTPEIVDELNNATHTTPVLSWNGQEMFIGAVTPDQGAIWVTYREKVRGRQ